MKIFRGDTNEQERQVWEVQELLGGVAIPSHPTQSLLLSPVPI